jgi:hypothetical protein
VVAVVLDDGDVLGEVVARCVAVGEDVREVAADPDVAGELDAHPLSTTAHESVRTGTDERRAQERGAGRGTSAVSRDLV